MFKNIKSILVSVVFIGSLIPVMSFAQTLGDTATGGTSVSQCTSLTSNLARGQSDTTTNGNIFLLQSFLNNSSDASGNPFFSLEPQQYSAFGRVTQNAVKSFQVQVYSNVSVNDIDTTLIPSASDRQQLAITGFVLSNTGYVGVYTRAKIAYVSCHNATPTGTSGIANPVNPTTPDNPTPPTNPTNNSAPVISGIYPDTQESLMSLNTTSIPTATGKYIIIGNHFDPISNSVNVYGKATTNFHFSSLLNGTIIIFDPADLGVTTAGNYYVQVVNSNGLSNQILVNVTACGALNNRIGCNTTSTTSPQITSVTSDSQGNITITGVRFDPASNVVNYGAGMGTVNYPSTNGGTTIVVPRNYNGTYHIQVSNSNGISNQASVTVNVASCGTTNTTGVGCNLQTNAPVISSVSPTSASIGTNVTINGSGFTSVDSTVYIDGYSSTANTLYAIQPIAVSSNGTAITFTLPTYSSPRCGLQGTSVGVGCPAPSLIAPGSHVLNVKNGNGVSNSIIMTVTSAQVQNQNTGNTPTLTVTSFGSAPSGSAPLSISLTANNLQITTASEAYAIDWGDGSSPSVIASGCTSATSCTTAGASHVYQAAQAVRTANLQTSIIYTATLHKYTSAGCSSNTSGTCSLQSLVTNSTPLAVSGPITVTDVPQIYLSASNVSGVSPLAVTFSSSVPANAPNSPYTLMYAGGNANRCSSVADPSYPTSPIGACTTLGAGSQATYSYIWQNSMGDNRSPDTYQARLVSSTGQILGIANITVSKPSTTANTNTNSTTLSQQSQTASTARPLISGTANVSTVYVSFINTNNGSMIAGSGPLTVTNGSWSGTPMTDLPSGAYTVSVYNSIGTLLTSGALTVNLGTAQANPVTTTAPTAPALTTSVTSTYYTVSWSRVSGIDYYNAIDAGTSAGGSVNTSSSWSIPLSSFTPSTSATSHTAYVKACNAGTNVCSSWSSVTINVPATVANTQATPLPVPTVSVNGTPLSNSGTAQIASGSTASITYGNTGGQGTCSVNGGTPPTSVTASTNIGTYTYTCSNTTGSATFSFGLNFATAQTATVTNTIPAVPTSSGSCSGTSASIGWQGATGATYYMTRINDTTAGTWTGSCSTSENGGNYCNNNDTINPHTWTGVAGHSYTTWVQACNNNGCSNGSSWPAFSCPQAQASAPANTTTTTTTAPTQPSFTTPPNFSASPILSTQSATFGWTANASYCNVSHPDGSSPWNNAPATYSMTLSGASYPNGLTTTVTCYGSTGISTAVTATLAVCGQGQAIYNGGCTTTICPQGQTPVNGACPVAQASAPAPATNSIPAVPASSGSNVPSCSGTSASISWGAVSGATFYQTRINDTTAGIWTGTCSTAENGGNYCNNNETSTSHSWAGVAGHSYATWVHACNSNGCSNASNWPTFSCGAVHGASISNICINLGQHMSLGITDKETSGEVTRLQLFLKERGYFKEDITGIFGKVTESAVKSFQTDKNLIVTGQVGQVTRDTIKSLSCGN